MVKEKSPSSTWVSRRYAGRWLILLIYICVAAFLFHVIIAPTKSYISYNTANMGPELLAQDPTGGRKVMIYAATAFFGHPITTERFLAHCPEVQKYCRISSASSDALLADGIVFHNADYRKDDKLKYLLENRKPDVPLVLWSLESPSNDNFRPDKYVINWTMTYRTDADIWAPYGNLESGSEIGNIEEELERIWKMKTKQATWLASNCVTQNSRFDLVKKMTELGFDIEIWGNCGKQPGKCSGVDNQESKCVLDLLKPYKFYISIENSNCKDYITEKFWKALGERQAVPIVLSRSYYKALGVPDSAYIAIDDFLTFEDFIAHVKKVSKSKELYLKYHEWRRDYRVFIGGGFSGFCSLCSTLQDPEAVNKKRKIYRDVAWWHSYQTCNNSIANRFLS